MDILILLFHCVKSVRIRSFSGPYCPTFGLNTERCSVSLRIQSDRMEENTDQKNSEYGHFLRSISLSKPIIFAFAKVVVSISGTCT